MENKTRNKSFELQPYVLQIENLSDKPILKFDLFNFIEIKNNNNNFDYESNFNNGNIKITSANFDIGYKHILKQLEIMPFRVGVTAIVSDDKNQLKNRIIVNNNKDFITFKKVKLRDDMQKIRHSEIIYSTNDGVIIERIEPKCHFRLYFYPYAK